VSRPPRWRLDPLGGGPWSGGDAGAWAFCVLAPNPGPMTLDGTNTWVVSAPGASAAVVIDPGPDDPDHLRAVGEAVERRGCTRVAAVLLTHGHLDHSEGARTFAESAGCGVRALDPRHRLGSEGLVDGDTVAPDGARLDVVATPGHTGDSLSFVLAGERLLLTGDTVLGRGTAVIDHPDGELGAYLATLDRLEDLVHRHELAGLLPGHGPVLYEPLAVVRAYRDHRRQRLSQVRRALDDGARDVQEVVAAVYTDVDRSVWPAAARSVAAQLVYLGVPVGP